MSRNSFNLTAELNLRGPGNLRVIASNIRRQLSNISVNINPQINPRAMQNVTRLNASFATLNNTLQTTSTNAANVTQALNALANAAAGIRNVNLNAQGITQAARAARQVNTTLTRTATAARQAGTAMEQFGEQGALAVRRFAAYTAATAGIFALTNAVKAGVSAFIDFDKEFVRLQQVTGESAKGLKDLASEITRLSTTFGVGSKELTNVAVTLAQAGLTAKETKQALEALAKSDLAPSFDDMNETVEGSIALMRQFNISAADLEVALGSINAVSAQFAVEASDLITAIQKTGGVFATASKGVSEGKDALNEFLAVFTSIRATTRESAETIATGLRTIFTRIQRADTVEALKELGINLRNAEGQFVGAYEAVRRLSQGLNTIDPRSREFSAISEELGGFRQIGKVIPLIQQFAVAQQALKVAQKGQGSLAKDAATAQLSLANQIAKVQQEFTALVRSIGESDSFRSFVRLSLDLASALIKLADSAKIVLPALTALAVFKGVSAVTQFGRGFARNIVPRAARDGGEILAFNKGGSVPGRGDKDTVPARLTPGEFVMNRKAVQRVGRDKLETLNKGGKVQSFKDGGTAKIISPTDLFVGPGRDSAGWQSTLAEIYAQNGLTYDATQRKLRVGSQIIDPKKALGTKQLSTLSRTVTPAQLDLIQKSASQIRDKYIERQQQQKGLKSNSEVGELVNSGLLFGAVGLKGLPFPAKEYTVTKGLKAPVKVGVIGATVAENFQAKKKRLDNLYRLQKINDKRVAKGKTPFETGTAQGILAAPTQQSILDVIGGSGKRNQIKLKKKEAISEVQAFAQLLDQNGQLFLDFDRTIASGASKVMGKDGFSNPRQVATALKGAKLTGLGKKLQSLTASLPPDLSQQFLSKLNIVSARPNSTIGLVAAWLKRQGLNIPRSNVVGVGGAGVGAAAIGERKVQAILQKTGGNLGSSVFIDDKSTNVKAASKSGIRSLQYGASLSKKAQLTATEQEGADFENYVATRLPATIQEAMASTTKGIDFPFGLGKEIAINWFNNARLASIPTDAKRTLNGPSSISDNLTTHLKGMGYAKGGVVKDYDLESIIREFNLDPKQIYAIYKKLKKDGGISPNLFDELDKRPIQRPELQFPIMGMLSKKKDALMGMSRQEAHELIASQIYMSGEFVSGKKIVDAKPIKENRKFIFPNSASKTGYSIETDNIVKDNTQIARLRAMVNAKPKSSARLAKETRMASLPALENSEEIINQSKIAIKAFKATGKLNLPPTMRRYFIQNIGDEIRSVREEDGPENQKTKKRIASIGIFRRARKQNIDVAGQRTALSEALNALLNKFVEEQGGLEKNIPKRPFNSLGQYAGIVGLLKDVLGPEKALRTIRQASTQEFASGGIVPAMVSNGEAIVDPATARSIGYSKLKKMNQADRFAKGGISVLKGPGTGTSDSIGPVGLPAGSFVLREKATKALGISGYKSGGYIGIKNFRRGGSGTPASLQTDLGAFKALQSSVKNLDPEIIKYAMEQFAKALKAGTSGAWAYHKAIRGVVRSLDYDASVRGAADSTLPQNRGIIPYMYGDRAREEGKASVAYADPRSPAMRNASKRRNFGEKTSFADRARQMEIKADAIINKNGPNVYSDFAKIGANFNQTIANMGNSITKLKGIFTSTTTASSAAGGAIKTFGGLLGRSISMIGGVGARGLGLGAFTSARPSRAIVNANAAAATAATAIGGQAPSTGGFMGGIGGSLGLVATLAGGSILDSAAKAAGGEQTETGRNISAVGGNVLNYGAIGATVAGPLGAVAGAALGLVAGLKEAKAASEAFAEEQAKLRVDNAFSKNEENISAFIASGNKKDKQKALEGLQSVSDTEKGLYKATKRKRGEDIETFAGRQVELQSKGAKQAEQILSNSMIQSGKTFDELSKSMPKAEFQLLAKNIAEGDLEFSRLKVGFKEDVEKGKLTEQEALSALSNKAKAIFRRVGQEYDEAAKAAKAAKAAEEATYKLKQALEAAALDITKQFESVGQALNRTSYEIEKKVSGLDDVVSGRKSLGGTQLKDAKNILENPDAYDPERVSAARRTGARLLGESGAAAFRFAERGSQIKDRAIRVGENAQFSAGKSNKEIAAVLQRDLTKQIINTFGVGSDIANKALKELADQVSKVSDEGTFDVQGFVNEALKPLDNVFDQASKTISQAIDNLNQSFGALDAVAIKLADVEKQRIGVNARQAGFDTENALGLREALGIKTTASQKAQARVAERAARAGVAPTGYNADSLTRRRQDVVAQQNALSEAIARKEQQVTNNPANQQVSSELATLKARLAAANNTLEELDSQLGELPEVIQQNITDILGEIQNRVAEINAQRDAGAGLAEKIIGSTPKELKELSYTYNLLNNTARGQITTIQQSSVAQKAYYDALKSGQTQQEAVEAGQAAFAQQNQKALSMFQELAQVSGLKGEQFDKQRATLIENFAKATGQGSNSFIQDIVNELRKPAAQRAAEDPQLIALTAALQKAQQDQAKASDSINKKLIDDVARLYKEGVEPLAKSMATAAANINAAVGRIATQRGVNPVSRANGGIIYASGGQLINFKPKGTDTVPAMLTPGEFVVNRKATQNNLGLLKQINSGHYAEGGTVTPTIDRNVRDNQSAKLFNTLNRVDNNTSYVAKTVKKNETLGYSGGGIVYASQGRHIAARGTDTVPAMLTPGEFVVNKAATKKNLPLLKGINSGTSYLAEGGLVEQLAAKNVGGVKDQFDKLIMKKVRFLGDVTDPFRIGGSNILTKIANNSFSTAFSSLVKGQDYIEGVNYSREPKDRKYKVGSKNKILLGPQRMQQIYNQAIKREKALAKPGSFTTQKGSAQTVLSSVFSEIARFPEIFEYKNPNAFYENDISKAEASYVEKNITEEAKKTISDRISYLRRIKFNANTGLISLAKFDKNFKLDLNNPISGLPKKETKEAIEILKKQYDGSSAELKAIFFGKSIKNIRGINDSGKFSDKLFDPNNIPPNYYDILKNLYLSSTNTTTPTSSTQALARGGMVYASNGQLINFQPKGTDTVPAMLTPGEFVVNRRATKRNMDLLKQINSERYNNGGPVYKQNGGSISTASSPTGMGYAINISPEAQNFLNTLQKTLSEGFGRYVEQLSNINIPDKINFNLTAAPIEVRFTGSSVLESMSEGIQKMVTNIVNRELAKIYNNTGGELGQRPR